MLNIDSSGSSVKLQSTLDPVASTVAAATQDMSDGRSAGGMSLSYRVLLVAPDQASADHISSLLGISSAVAWVSGSCALAGSGYGYGCIATSTGSNGLVGTLGDSMHAKCGSDGQLIGQARLGRRDLRHAAMQLGQLGCQPQAAPLARRQQAEQFLAQEFADSHARRAQMAGQRQQMGQPTLRHLQTLGLGSGPGPA